MSPKERGWSPVRARERVGISVGGFRHRSGRIAKSGCCLVGPRSCGNRRLSGKAAVDEPMGAVEVRLPAAFRSEEHTSELQSLMRISYAVFCLKKKKHK